MPRRKPPLPPPPNPPPPNPPPPNPPRSTVPPPWSCGAQYGISDPLAVPNPIVYTRIPRSSACWAASNGIGPALLTPSVSSTMISGAYAPLGTGVGAMPGDESVTLGATFLSISAIASSDLRIPLPFAALRPVSSFRPQLAALPDHWWPAASLRRNPRTQQY